MFCKRDRRTVSKELHDSIGASLAAIKFSLEEKEMKRDQQNGRLDNPLEPDKSDSSLEPVRYGCRPPLNHSHRFTRLRMPARIG